MPAPTLSTLFQIGVDSALIQVPQNYTVPANPPSEPNPPNNLAIPTQNTQITTTSDSVTIYLSAIKGFNNTVSMTFLVQPITTTLAASLGYTLSPLDSTTAPWQGFIGSTSSNWLTGTYDGAASGWAGTLPFSMQSNVNNALNTYVAKNYQTLWINPGLSGGAINPSHPPSYLISIFAFDPVTNTYAACNFTLVVVPSIATYGLGVYTKANINGIGYSFVNSVNLPLNGYAPPKQSVVLNYFFYPLEPASTAPSPLNITINWFNSPLIDATHSVVANPDGPYAVPPGSPIALSTYQPEEGVLSAYGTGAIDGGFTRDSASGIPPNKGSHVLAIQLYLTNNTGSTPIYSHALLQVTATDGNGVSVSAYTVIYVVGAA